MITASIVTYHHSGREIGRLVDSLSHSAVDMLYIIDNSPNDALRQLEKNSDRVRYIHNANIGYGGAHNIAIRDAIESGADYHVIVNPDIELEPDAIGKLRDYMDSRTDIGLVMPNVVYPGGERQYLCKLLPTPEDLLLRRFLKGPIGKKRRERFELRFTEYDREMDVPFLSGCFMFLRTAALCEVGLFDERYFMYGEDIDLCRRIHSRFRTVFYPDVTIVHVHEAASYKSRKMLRIHTVNIIRYFNKWGWFLDPERKRVNKETLDRLSLQKTFRQNVK